MFRLILPKEGPIPRASKGNVLWLCSFQKHGCSDQADGCRLWSHVGGWGQPLVAYRSRTEKWHPNQKTIVTRGAQQMVVRNCKFLKYILITFNNHILYSPIIYSNCTHLPISSPGFRTKFDPRAGLHIGGLQRRGNGQAVEASSTTYLCAKGLQGAHPTGTGKQRLLPRWTGNGYGY